MEVLNIALCDDERVERELLEKYIGEWGKERGCRTALFPFSDAEALLLAKEGQEFDLVLLDIQMKGMDGMEAARRIREKDAETGIIFITGYEDYLEEGYEVEAFRYLLKPVREEKLREALDRFAARLSERQRKEKACWLLETAEGTKRIFLDELLYLEAFSHYCDLHTKTGCFLVKKSISGLEKEAQRLGLPLLRCHRSYLVCLPRVTGLEREQVILEDQTRLPVSRKHWAELNRAFIRWFRKDGEWD